MPLLCQTLEKRAERKQDVKNFHPYHSVFIARPDTMCNMIGVCFHHVCILRHLGRASPKCPLVRDLTCSPDDILMNVESVRSIG